MSAWTPERVETMKRLWADGMSASEIAKTLGGVSRNAVIGKLHRLPVSDTGVRKRAKPVFTRKRVAKPKKPRIFFHNIKKRDEDKLPPLPIKEPEVPIAPLMVSLMDLQPYQCHWPFGEPRDAGFGYCGHPRAPNFPHPYCRGHLRVIYQPGTLRKMDEAA